MIPTLTHFSRKPWVTMYLRIFPCVWEFVGFEHMDSSVILLPSKSRSDNVSILPPISLLNHHRTQPVPRWQSTCPHLCKWGPSCSPASIPFQELTSLLSWKAACICLWFIPKCLINIMYSNYVCYMSEQEERKEKEGEWSSLGGRRKAEKGLEMCTAVLTFKALLASTPVPIDQVVTGSPILTWIRKTFIFVHFAVDANPPCVTEALVPER